eukprot:jgi/Orpsp1_1/1191174/evm.model.d7180000083938.1
MELPGRIENLFNITVLNFTKNKIVSLPVEIGNLKNLSELYLQHNLLKELPEEIKNLEKLSILHLSHNRMQYFPEVICDLKNLKYLYLSDNYLSELPEEIGNLKNLIEMDLSNNKLMYYPKELDNLENIKEIYVSGNVSFNSRALEYMDFVDEIIDDNDLKTFKICYSNGKQVLRKKNKNSEFNEEADIIENPNSPMIDQPFLFYNINNNYRRYDRTSFLDLELDY